MARPMEAMCSVMKEVFKQESSPLSHDSSICLLMPFIEDTTELQIFGQERNCASWIGHINGCLNSSLTRLEGLSFLRALVNQCPVEVFQQHCVPWVRMLTQALQSYDPPAIIALVSEVLGSILREAAQVSELSRELANAHFAPIITTALELKTEWQDSAVEILSACIQYFPGPSGTFRTRVENFLVQLMGSSSDIDTAVSASRCLAQLPRVGGGGQGGVKHTEAWSYYCQRVLASIHGVVDKIYGNSRPEKQSETLHPLFALPDVPLKEPTRTYTLIRQYKVLCACLQHMLRAEFPEIVKIPVNGILSLCVTILVPNMLSKGLKSSLQSGHFAPLHVEAFNILSALISSCRGNLSLHRNAVNELFVKSHSFRPGVQSEGTKHRVLSGLKRSAYAALEVWLETVGVYSGIEMAAEKLLESILSDAQPQVQTTKLKVTTDKPFTLLNVKSSGKSKQKGKSAGAAGGETSTSLASQQAAMAPPSGQVCLAALKVLRCLLMSVGAKVKPDFHKDVHEFVITLLLRLQQSPSGLAPAPYSSADCRKALYHVLLSSVIAPHPRWPAPLQCAVGLFSRGRQDTSIKVSSFCAEASIICQSIIHPRVPCLQQPLSLAQLDPKRAPSQSVSEPRTRPDPDYMETTGLTVGLATTSQSTEGNSAVLDSSDEIAPSVDRDMPTRSANTMMEVDSNGTEESEDSSDDDIEDQEIAEDDPGIKQDLQIKRDYQEIMEIIQDQPEESATPKATTNGSDASNLPSKSTQLQADSVLDATDSSSGGKEVASSSGSLDNSKMPSPTRRSKRQLARVQERKEEENAVVREETGDADSGSKKKRREDKDENKEKNQHTGAVSDETDAMLASFVDSMPDKD